MRTLLLLICAWFITEGVPGAEEPVNPDPQGIFDFSDVPKAEEKKAEETAEKQDLLADEALPQDVQRMLNRLSVFEVVENSVLTKRIAPLRAALGENLLALSNKAAGQAKIDYITIAKSIEGLPLEEPMRPEMINLTPISPGGGDLWYRNDKLWNTFLPNGRIVKKDSEGTWRWLNKQHTLILIDFWERDWSYVITLKSPSDTKAALFGTTGSHFKLTRDTPKGETARKPPPDALRLIAETAKLELAAREQTTKEIEGKRTSVSKWLIEKAKESPPDAAVKMLASASALSIPAGTTQLERAERLAGVWRLPDGRKLEFRPDGNLLIDGKSGKATWSWSKIRNWSYPIILLGKQGDPSEAWLGRFSSKDPGILRITTSDRNFDAKRE